MNFDHVHHYLESLLSFVTVIVLTLPWTYRWARNIDLMARFVKHAHDEELPRIHEALEDIAPKVGLTYERPIEKIAINGK